MKLLQNIAIFLFFVGGSVITSIDGFGRFYKEPSVVLLIASIIIFVVLHLLLYKSIEKSPSDAKKKMKVISNFQKTIFFYPSIGLLWVAGTFSCFSSVYLSYKEFFLLQPQHQRYVATGFLFATIIAIISSLLLSTRNK